MHLIFLVLTFLKKILKMHSRDLIDENAFGGMKYSCDCVKLIFDNNFRLLSNIARVQESSAY